MPRGASGESIGATPRVESIGATTAVQRLAAAANSRPAGETEAAFFGRVLPEVARATSWRNQVCDGAQTFRGLPWPSARSIALPLPFRALPRPSR